MKKETSWKNLSLSESDLKNKLSQKYYHNTLKHWVKEAHRDRKNKDKFRKSLICLILHCTENN